MKCDSVKSLNSTEQWVQLGIINVFYSWVSLFFSNAKNWSVVDWGGKD